MEKESLHEALVFILQIILVHFCPICHRKFLFLFCAHCATNVCSYSRYCAWKSVIFIPNLDLVK